MQAHESGQSYRRKINIQCLGSTEDLTPCVVPESWAEWTNENDRDGANGGFRIRLKRCKMTEWIIVQDTVGDIAGGWVLPCWLVNMVRGAHDAAPCRKDGTLSYRRLTDNPDRICEPSLLRAKPS